MSISPDTAPVTIGFDEFWAWLQMHRNCIIRAGTATTVVFDHDDYHWSMAAEDEQTFLVQVGRGKDLVAEIVLNPQEIAYIQTVDLESDEFGFELMVESENVREVAYHFVLAHAYDEEAEPGVRRWTH